MNLFEQAANRNFFLEQKLIRNKKPSIGYRKSLESKMIRKPEVLNLMEGGYDNFKKSVVKRILKEHSGEIIFNRCPNCNRLVRTPLAKQCNHCFHKWHTQNE